MDVGVGLGQDRTVNVLDIQPIEKVGIERLVVVLHADTFDDKILGQPEIEASVDEALEGDALGIEVGWRQVVEDEVDAVNDSVTRAWDVARLHVVKENVATDSCRPLGVALFSVGHHHGRDGRAMGRGSCSGTALS